MDKPTCVMCGEKPGKPLVAGYRSKEDGKTYVYENATGRPLFCSVRCAANHALLWFDFEGFRNELEIHGHETDAD